MKTKFNIPVESNLACTLLMAMTASVVAHSGYQEREGLLNAKQRFAENEINALSRPFTGVKTSKGLETGLFPIKATGVSTEPIVNAAKAFLSSLAPEQHVRTVFGVDDPEWRRWCNVDNGIYVRQGVSLKEMSASQRKAAMDLLQISLSAKGFALSEAIRRTDQTLREINQSPLEYDEDLYFFTVMGLPSRTERWGWQIDGHHLIINYFVLGDQVVMTPLFLGGEPIVTKSGKYKGNIILQAEQNEGLALMRGLDDSQRKAATLASRKPKSNNQAEAYKDNLVLDYSGVSVATFSDSQRKQFVALIGLFVGNLRDDHARVRMEEVKSHLDKTWFAWVGDVSDDAVFYYRIHSPVLLIEFDHQVPVGTTKFNPRGIPTRDHIHVVVRTPNGNDYGKDLLRQHLLQHAH